MLFFYTKYQNNLFLSYIPWSRRSLDHGIFWIAFGKRNGYNYVMRRIELSIGEYYHIYNRGTDKRGIFLSPKDYERFIALLHVCNAIEPINARLQRRSLKDTLAIKQPKRLVDIGTYCLMPNHFHLLIRERRENGISLFMHRLSTAYTMYFNIKNNRTGSLFEGVFKAQHVNTDEYLKYLF